MSLEVRFILPVGKVPDGHQAEAERKAREAFVLTLLSKGDISAGRAAELLGLDRWRLGEIMSLYGLSPFDETLTSQDLKREAFDPARDA
jgi:hypothetical protein